MKTVKEVIEHVINTDASAFRAALIQQANSHADFIEMTRNQRAREGGQAQLNACLAAYDLIGKIDHPLFGELTAADSAQLIANEFASAIVAFNIACKLAGVDYPQRTAMMVDHAQAAGWSN